MWKGLMTSGDMMFIPSLMKIHLFVKMLVGREMYMNKHSRVMRP
jgi:hypothetical protein